MAQQDGAPNGFHFGTAEFVSSSMSDGARSPRSCQQCRKVFNDAVHGSIELPLLCVRIMNTPEFQRLRFVKQVGSSYFLYPAASHNRFEHCLGVSFLAGCFAEQLKREQPELNISEQDVLCVQVAGLCHDLGHGPFSHLWQEYMEEHLQDWTHEDAGATILDHLLFVNNIDVTKYGLNGEQDVTFIKELFLTAKKCEGATDWPYKGRTREKAFLYHIVANSENGVDVDKFDYFLRDSHNLGVSVTFDYKRLMQHSRVVEVPETNLLSICCRDKEAENVFELFSNRCQLHKKAYQHRICKVINVMILDVFQKAGRHLEYKGSNGKLYSLPEMVSNMTAYCQLTDDVLMQVLRLESEDEEVREAKEIVRKIFSRELYPTVGNTLPLQPHGVKVTKRLEEEIESKLRSLIDQNNNKNVVLYQKALASVAVYDTVLNFGNGDKNPLDRIWFYSKNEPSKVFRMGGDQVSTMMPRSFQEVIVRVSSRSYDEKVIKVLQGAFKDACGELGWKWSEDDRSPSHMCIHSRDSGAAAPGPVATTCPQ